MDTTALKYPTAPMGVYHQEADDKGARPLCLLAKPRPRQGYASEYGRCHRSSAAASQEDDIPTTAEPASAS